MMARSLLGIVRSLNPGQHQKRPSGTLAVGRTIRLVSLLFLLKACVLAMEDMPDILQPTGTSGLAVGQDHASFGAMGDEGMATNYFFNPSHAFWKPLSSFPSASFPPYDLGHHPHHPHRIIYASCNRQPEGEFRGRECKRGWVRQNDSSIVPNKHKSPVWHLFQGWMRNMTLKGAEYGNISAVESPMLFFGWGTMYMVALAFCCLTVAETVSHKQSLQPRPTYFSCATFAFAATAATA